MSATRFRTILTCAMLIVALALALLSDWAGAAEDDDGPELDRARVATCEARGGRLARNHQGQMLCKDAKVKLKAWLKQHPEAANAEAASGVSAPIAKPPTYTPTTTGTLTVPAGAPAIDGGQPGQGVVELHPPPKPNTATRERPYQAAPTGTHTVEAGAPTMPPVLQPPKPKGGTCYLRSCLFSSYSKSCQCMEFNSAELCQFKETTPGGKCADGGGNTTALCPAGYSCINNSCRQEAACGTSGNR